MNTNPEPKFTIGLSYWKLVELVASLSDADRQKFYERVEKKLRGGIARQQYAPTYKEAD
jgi:hypothetical protein